MKKNIISAILVSSLIIIFATSCTSESISEYKTVIDKTLDKYATEIEINWNNGTITLEKSKDEQIHLMQSAPDQVAWKDWMTWEMTGDHLVINDQNDKLFGFTYGSDLTVSLPESTYDNWYAETKNGTINCSDLSFQNINITTTNGDINIDTACICLTAETTNGDLYVSCPSIPDTISLTGTNGNAILALPQDSGFTLLYDGNVNSDFPLLESDTDTWSYLDGASQINVSTTNGGLTLQEYSKE